MQRESDKRRSWKNKERERWDLKRLLDEQKNNVFSQALALAILNGTADKMELEKREKEENEYSSLSSLDLSSNIDFQMFHSHFSSELGCEKRMRIWKRQQKPPSLRRTARSPSSPTPPSSSSPPITSESGQGGLWHTGSSRRNLKDKGLFKVLRGRIKTMKKSLAWCWVLKNLSTKTIYKVEP